MDGYRASVPALQAHAQAVRDQGNRLAEVAKAADHPIAAGAFGVICEFLSGMTNDAEGRLRSSVGTLASVTGSHATGLAGSAAAYQRAESHLAGIFRGAR